MLRFSYLAIIQSAIPLWNRQFSFNKGDVRETIPYKWLPQRLLWFRQASNFYRLESILVLLHHSSFKKPIYLIEMLNSPDKFIRKTKVYWHILCLKQFQETRNKWNLYGFNHEEIGRKTKKKTLANLFIFFGYFSLFSSFYKNKNGQKLPKFL